MWLDFAEDQARRRKEIFLKDWEEKLDAFLKFNDRNVLPNAGNISKKQADARAEEAYARYATARRTLLEAEGAEQNLKMLEAAAKVLPKTTENG
ncbi:RhuM family protein [Methylococcus sp. EFPC2]|uniref:RhuM family protein n=1 Tax=Methylococcus sp. EFPC2 TaxID=2812648 RepID=UPI0019678F59|nr:RhuM family protein [Methylococcus sp. EFPC2]QSA97604.1 virulence RhuM family protein [Methylococcus sp. EFPC2]